MWTPLSPPLPGFLTFFYIASTFSHRIRKIVIYNGTVTTLAGSSKGTTDTTGSSARFSGPVTPGNTLVINAWSEDSHTIANVIEKETDTVVLKDFVLKSR